MHIAQLFRPSALCSIAPRSQSLASSGPKKASSFLSTVFLFLCTGLLVASNPAQILAQAAPPTPEFTSIVVFGDSLSDTGNLAHLTYDKYGVRIPGPVADYTDGRSTDGFDTIPPAQNYSGVWVEQLADSMSSKPETKASLDGGTNYAYGFATTGSGYSLFSFGPGNALSVNVENIGQQITDYLSTHPKINEKTLFVIWGGAIDLLNATSENDVIDAGINQTLNIQRLIDAGARHFIVPNLPALGLVPRLNGSPTTSIPATAASVLYNHVLESGIALIRDFNPTRHLQIAQLDVFSLFNKIVTAPASYSLTNTTASSQGLAVDPDTYLFWDDLHPTTRGHNILAVTAASILARSNCMSAVSNRNGPVGVGASACGAMVQ